MDSSQTTTAHAVELPTTLGTVHVLAQDYGTLYVRAGLDERELSELAQRPLGPLRGALLSLRAHYKLSPEGEWKCPQPFVHRVDQKRDKDPTAGMVRAAVAAAREAFEAAPELPELLDRAGHAKAQAEAASRLAVALKLRECADALDLEAQALVDGGRVVYLRGRMNGLEVRTTQVQTADGELLPPVRTPPTVYGSTDWPDSIHDQRPEDRW